MTIFKIKVLASDRVFYEGDVESITLTTVDGEIGILANHEEMVIGIVPGELRITTAGQERIVAASGSGFAKVQKDVVIVLVSSAERPEEIDELRALEAKERALEKLKHKEDLKEFHRSRAAMARALSRLDIINKYGNKKI
ncbi:ATP synthase F1 subunit epsilon [Alloiococcus sp. CFN-8]|uniref:ATP synthase F1 subunit epsilon n=1 Tax=Alloiococcus sp. CFN-8 TaxID=3416081 RepID=UPI003CF03206